MDNTIIQQGFFTSDGTDKFLNLRSGVDWIEVMNLTEIAGANNGHGCFYQWQYGMASGDGVVLYHPAADQTLACDTNVGLATRGFIPFSFEMNPVGPAVAVTSISNALPPRVLVASTAGMADGDIVRIINTAGGQQLGGMDFTLTVADGTHFDLTNMPAIVAAAGPGTYRLIAHTGFYAPKERFLTKITQAVQAVVTTAVDHGYNVGDLVRFAVPAAFGMIEINGLTGTVVAITQHTFTVNIDTTAFTAFAFPLTAAVPFSPAVVTPVGEASTYGTLNDATENIGVMGIILAAGVTGPGGSNGDVIKWKAGKSFANNLP